MQNGLSCGLDACWVSRRAGASRLRTSKPRPQAYRKSILKTDRWQDWKLSLGEKRDLTVAWGRSLAPYLKLDLQDNEKKAANVKWGKKCPVWKTPRRIEGRT
jgi:hypothetical protein